MYIVSRDVEQCGRCNASERKNHALLAELPARLREVAVLLVGTGMSQKQIAAQLGIQPGALHTHVERLYRTLDVHSRAELGARLRAG